MRVVILTMGTRGDVQPFVALARGLRAAGHDPVVVAPQAFAEFVSAYGVNFVPFPGDPAAFIQRLIDRGGSRLRMIREVVAFAMPIAREVLNTALEASRGADVILANFLLTVGGYQVARQLDVPFISTQLFPTFTPTDAFPMAGMPAGSAFANRMTHHVATGLFWNSSRMAYQVLKRQAPEVPRTLENPFGRSLKTIYGFSSHVIAPPPDLDARTRITGYWFLPPEDAWTPPAALSEFLAAGDPPVYVGFGSMVSETAQHLSQIVIDALKRTKRRAILLGGWGKFGSETLPDHVMRIDSAPHEWLFDRVAAVVHHGGAGTTGASLRAGKPTLIIPFTADQPFWGDRVMRLGVSPAPIAYKRLSAAALSESIEVMLTDADMQARAAAIGRKIKGEDGIGNAIAAVQSFL